MPVALLLGHIADDAFSGVILEMSDRARCMIEAGRYRLIEMYTFSFESFTWATEILAM